MVFPCRIGRLFLCCAKRYHGDSSGAFQWDVYRCCTDLSEYGKNSGPDHGIYCFSFPHFSEALGRANAGYHTAGKRCGNMLEGREAVEEGLIDEVGGMKEALAKLYELIDLQKAEKKM